MKTNRVDGDGIMVILGGRYEVHRQIGKQAGRKTLLARDLKTQESVIVKLLSLGSDFEWQHLKLFEREADTLKALSHPAIPRYLDYLELDSPKNKAFALVQSYVKGKTLEEHLKSGRTFSEAEVKELAKALLDILIYLHGHQPPVIHRDIKPSNILLTNCSDNSVGQVYLIDFGSVQTLAAQEGGTITVVGTYGYMPPEQFGGRTTPASDLYSLGATLIYLITGLHPTELPQKDLQIQFQQVAKLDRTFADWIEWMIQPSLDRRFTSATEALQALEKPRRRNKATSTSVVKQPLDSNVILTKTADMIEAIVPPKLYVHSFRYLALLWVILFFVLRNYILAICFFAIALFPLFGRIHLRIDRQKVFLTNELFGLRWNRLRPISRWDVSQLVLAKKYVHNPTGEIVQTKRGLMTKQWLLIQAREQKYELVGIDSLTEPELHWLADELSNWMGVPIAELTNE